MQKKPRPKKCKNCKETFQPIQPLQYVCGYKCAAEYAKLLREKKEAKEWKEKKKVLKDRIETKTDCEKKLQKEINTIVRLLDAGHNCPSTGAPLQGKFDAGHLYSVGSNPTIRFHLFNIFGQTVHANQHKGGMPLEYVEGLKSTFGNEIAEYCLSLKSIDSIHLSKDEIKDLTSKARSIVKWLKLQDRQFTTHERISLRVKFNNELNIYKV